MALSFDLFLRGQATMRSEERRRRVGGGTGGFENPERHQKHSLQKTPNYETAKPDHAHPRRNTRSTCIYAQQPKSYILFPFLLLFYFCSLFFANPCPVGFAIQPLVPDLQVFYSFRQPQNQHDFCNLRFFFRLRK